MSDAATILNPITAIRGIEHSALVCAYGMYATAQDETQRLAAFNLLAQEFAKYANVDLEAVHSDVTSVLEQFKQTTH